MRLGCADAFDGMDTFEFVAGIRVRSCWWRRGAAGDAFQGIECAV